MEINYIFAAKIRNYIKNDITMYWTLELASKLEDAPWPASKDELIDKIVALCDAKRLRVSDICKTAKVNELTDLTKERLEGCIEWIESI